MAKVLISLLGMDQHEVGALTVSRILRDAGFEVVYLGRFQTPDSIVRAALEEGVQAIGISCYSWEFRTYVPQLLRTLEEEGLAIPVVVGGGVLSEEDEAWLRAMGVKGVFRAGSPEGNIVRFFQELVATSSQAGTSVP
jgi:methylmalonyl-CoA mutase C-terminal domain/subunit